MAIKTFLKQFNKYKSHACFIISFCIIWIYYDINRVQVQIETILETNTTNQGLKSDRLDNLKLELPRKYAVISVNLIIKNSYYFFNLPMISVAWRRIGFEPVVLIIYSNLNQANKLANKTIEYLNSFNVRLVYVKAPPGYETTISMLSRLYVGLLPNVAENDFLITTDSDLYPIRKSYYDYMDENALKVWNAYCCEKFIYENEYYEMYPISHIGMKKWQWREVMNLNERDELDGETIIKRISLKFNEKIHIKSNKDLVKGNVGWFLDQMAISVYIKNYLILKSNSKLEKIRYEGIRLDRSMTKYTWMRTIQLYYDSITDCHSFQVDALDNWNLLQPLYLKLFNRKFKIIFDRYFMEYKDLFKEIS